MEGLALRGNVLEFSASIDAVTMVSQDQKGVLAFYNEYETWTTFEEVRVHRERPWGMHGYRGKQRRSIRVGLKEDRAILSATGPHSHRLVSLAKALPVKFTRIDLQITTVMDSPIQNLAKSTLHSGNLQSEIERGKLWLSYVNSPDGDTLYINKRTSPTFGRIYDKSRDFSEVRGKIWRYETEVKEELADRIGQVLVNVEKLNEFCADYVASWFADREICVPIEPRSKPSIPKVPTNPAGIDQTLFWLSKQVRPSLEWLISIGLKPKVEEALGFQLDFGDFTEKELDF